MSACKKHPDATTIVAREGGFGGTGPWYYFCLGYTCRLGEAPAPPDPTVVAFDTETHPIDPRRQQAKNWSLRFR